MVEKPDYQLCVPPYLTGSTLVVTTALAGWSTSTVKGKLCKEISILYGVNPFRTPSGFT